MPFNIKTLSHIAMIDLEGRHGLQGHNLHELIIFLHDYIKTQTDVDKNLIDILNQIIDNYNKIEELESHPSYSKLEHLAEQFQTKICALQPGQSFYLPGGWVNRDMDSHGMILSFTKTINDHLEFRIYNGGAGMQLHDEIANIETVKYMPVKIYQLSLSKVTSVNFKNFIGKLIEPQISHAPWRNTEYFSYDEYLLYDEIHLHIHTMQGQILDSREIIDTRLAGSGISSGTCSQASIQQFLKVYLNNMPQFKKFMVLYKIYTIENYLKEAPEPSTIIARLINKAIVNIHRILDDATIFSDKEYEVLCKRLMSLRVSQPNCFEQSHEKNIKLPATPQVLFFPSIHTNKKNDSFIFQYVNPKIEFIVALKNLEEFFAEDLQRSHQFKQQAFQKLLDIPIQLGKNYTQNELLEMMEKLANIAQHFHQDLSYEKGSLEEMMFQLLLLTLIDLIAQKLHIQNKTTPLLLKHILAHYKKNYQLFSIDTRIHSKINAILKIYPPEALDFSKENVLKVWDAPPKEIIDFIEDAKKGNLPESAWGIQQLNTNFEYLDCYRKKTEFHEILNKLYKSSDKPLNIKIEKFNLQALSVLMNDILSKLCTHFIIPDAHLYQNKNSPDELRTDLAYRAQTSVNALYLLEPIQELKEELLDYLCMLETLQHHSNLDNQKYQFYGYETNCPQLKSKYEKLETIISRKASFDAMKWIRKNLREPQIQQDIELYMLFICAYMNIKTNTVKCFIKKSDLVMQINQFLNKYEVYHQNILFLKEHHLLDIIQNILIDKKIDTCISITLSKREIKIEPIALILNNNDILQCQYSTLHQDFLKNLGCYSLKKLDDITIDLNTPLNITSSNDIECGQHSRIIKSLSYIQLSDDFSIILLLEYFSQPNYLCLLQNETKYLQYFQSRLFNIYILDLAIDQQSQNLIKSMEKLCNKSYQLNGENWNEKNICILRIKCYLICYAYLKNAEKFSGHMQKLEKEIQSLPDNSSKKYCEFILLSSRFIQGEAIDLNRLDSINRNLIHEQYTKKFNEIESRILESQENHLQFILRKHSPNIENFIVYSPRNANFNTIEKYLSQEMIELFHLPKNTLTIEKTEEVIEVLSTPIYYIHMNEGQLQSIQKKGKLWLSHKNVANLPLIFDDEKVLIWQDIEQPQQIILERNDKPFLKVTSNGFYSLEENPGQLAYGELDLKISNFEDLSYVLSFQYQDGSSTSNLERYNIAFKKDAQGKIFFLNDPTFHLIENIHSPFPSEVACLMLESDKKEQQCLVPFQQFYFEFIAPQSIPSGQYQPIVHDIHLRLSEKNKQNKQLYVVFDVEDGIPRPRNTKDALYLCYIYMATRQYQKANQLLKNMIRENSFTATEEEVSTWIWILYACPIQETDFKAVDCLNHQYYVEQKSGEELACRLRTIVLMGLRYQQGHKIDTERFMNKFTTDYLRYQILSRELLPEYILEPHEKNAFFLLNPQTPCSSTTFDKVQTQIYQLQRLKQASDDEHIIQDLNQRIENLEKVYIIDSTFTESTTSIPSRYHSNDFPKDEIILSAPSSHSLYLNISLSEIQKNFPGLMNYFMHTPKPEDLELLKVLILKTQKRRHEPRQAFLLLLYLMYEQKDTYPYKNLPKKTSFIELWERYSSTHANIKIPQNAITRIEWTDINPLLSNEQILHQMLPMVPKTQKIEISVPPSRLFLSSNQEYYQKACLELENEWNTILNVANALDTKVKRKAYFSGRFQPLTKKDLLNCYIQDNIYSYMSTCMMSQMNAQELHLAIHRALYHELEKQWFNKHFKLPSQDICELEEQFPQEPSSIAPAMMYLQYNLEILLRPEQIRVIETALSPNSPDYQLISLPMGSGKTKILLPCLANYFANGKQLSMIEVPVALLQSTYQDFQTSALTHFNKTVYLLTFERWKNINPGTLQRLFEHLENVIVNKHIIMTSPDAIQSLILQYIELLQLDSQKYQKEIEYLGKIICIFQTRTTTIIDEAHHILSPHTVHNFSLGEKQAVSRQHIQFLINFFRYQDSNKITNSSQILQCLIADVESPLMKNINESHHPYLAAYFNNDHNACHYIDQYVSIKEKELLAFYRFLLVSHNNDKDCFYDKVRQLKLFVDYGPSKTRISPLDAQIAIPYETNNTPLENSEFSYHWITMFCTANMLFQQKMCENLFQSILEFIMNDVVLQKKIDIIFLKLNININFLDLDNKIQIQEVLKKLHSNNQLYHEFLYWVLEECLFPRIKIDTKTLSQNSYQHLHSMHRVVAFTGTIGQVQNYSDELVIDDRLTKDSHERLLQCLEKKSTSLIRCDDKTPRGLLSFMQKKGAIQKHFSAIIDISAHFTGISNEEVAHAIVEFLLTQHTDKTHVLFFNTKNELCAISIHSPENILMIGGTTTAKIQKALRGIQPEQYFVYYDQSHAFGVDIRLEEKSFALVLTDEHHEFSQGCTRLRELEKEQNLSLVVPSKSEANNLRELDSVIKKNQQKKIQASIVDLAMKKCENLIYQKVLRKVTENPNFFPMAKSFLISTKFMSSLYESDGLPHQNINTMIFLQNYQTTLLHHYQKIFGNEDLHFLETKMQKIINNISHENLTNQYPISAQRNMDERITNLSIEHKKTHQINHAQLKEKEQIQQISVNLNPLPMEINHISKSLNDWLQTKIFSSHLKASSSLMNTYEGQCFDNLQALKPIFLIEFYIQKPERLVANLISMEEYQKPIGPNHWFTTITGEVLSGHVEPKWLKTSEYKSFLEQAQFYNGDFEMHREDSPNLRWLTINTHEKINFYKQNLMKIRQTNENIIDELFQTIETKLKLTLVESMIKNQKLKQHLTDIIKQWGKKNYWNTWQKKEWSDYPLRIILMMALNAFPKKELRSLGFSFFRKKEISDEDILNIINLPSPLSTDELNIVFQYIKTKDSIYNRFIIHQLENSSLPFRTSDEYEKYLHKYQSPSDKEKNTHNA